MQCTILIYAYILSPHFRWRNKSSRGLKLHLQCTSECCSLWPSVPAEVQFRVICVFAWLWFPERAIMQFTYAARVNVQSFVASLCFSQGMRPLAWDFPTLWSEVSAIDLKEACITCLQTYSCNLGHKLALLRSLAACQLLWISTTAKPARLLSWTPNQAQISSN